VKKTYAFAEVKSLSGENPNGEFEVILSAQTVDRDGEVIEARAFEPLPESIPMHAFHDFDDPIGRAWPFYDGDVLKARGVFASTHRAQEIRTLVSEGVIGHTSVGFMSASRTEGDNGVPHITKGELLEASFVSVPSNREAAVLMAKSVTVASSRKCHGMSANTLRERLSTAAQDAHPDEWPWVRDYSEEWVVYEVYSDDSVTLWQEAYEVREGTPFLSGDRAEVHAEINYTPKVSTDAPAAPDVETSGKSLASDPVVAAALTRARLTLLLTE
jgi:HK97 family phage prohead protease